jgi:flagellar basal-body rod protein FlgC
MDYASVFAISGAGMNLQQLRLTVTAANLANAQTTTPAGSGYRPLRVVARAPVFASFLSGIDTVRAMPMQVDVVPAAGAPRLVHDPGHPDADARGFVSYPDVNPVSEMVRLVEIGRAYEANVRALSLARTMAQRALEIGSER